MNNRTHLFHKYRYCSLMYNTTCVLFLKHALLKCAFIVSIVISREGQYLFSTSSVKYLKTYCMFNVFRGFVTLATENVSQAALPLRLETECELCRHVGARGITQKQHDVSCFVSVAADSVNFDKSRSSCHTRRFVAIRHQDSWEPSLTSRTPTIGTISSTIRLPHSSSLTSLSLTCTRLPVPRRWARWLWIWLSTSWECNCWWSVSRCPTKCYLEVSLWFHYFPLYPFFVYSICAFDCYGRLVSRPEMNKVIRITSVLQTKHSMRFSTVWCGRIERNGSGSEESNFDPKEDHFFCISTFLGPP